MEWSQFDPTSMVSPPPQQWFVCTSQQLVTSTSTVSFSTSMVIFSISKFGPSPPHQRQSPKINSQPPTSMVDSHINRKIATLMVSPPSHITGWFLHINSWPFHINGQFLHINSLFIHMNSWYPHLTSTVRPPHLLSGINSPKLLFLFFNQKSVPNH